MEGRAGLGKKSNAGKKRKRGGVVKRANDEDQRGEEEEEEEVECCSICLAPLSPADCGRGEATSVLCCKRCRGKVRRWCAATGTWERAA